jgi:hypothetical protein
MTRTFARRARRVHGDAHDLLGDSRWTIWCFEPKHMPAMIDLLIAEGALGESDRPHCVHWRAVKGRGEATPDDLAKVIDADAMLDKAGIRTLSGKQWQAWMEGPQALEALYRKWFGEMSADERRASPSWTRGRRSYAFASRRAGS